MKARILVVDDERDMVELLAFNLRRHGYEVSVARDGLEALKRVRSFRPDLVLLDLKMEGIDGYTVCEILRRQPSTAAVLIIILTGLVGQIPRLNCLEAGADDFATKPFNVKDLLRRVEAVLESCRNQRQTLRAIGAESLPQWAGFGLPDRSVRDRGPIASRRC